MKDFKNIVKVASVYLTTIIGAGFASGQEILQFFSSYYRGGFYGIILTGILFSLIGWCVLSYVYKFRIRNFDEYIFPVAGWLVGWIIQLAVILFMFCIYCVMLAGIGSIVSIRLGIPFFAVTTAFSVICLLILLKDIKGIVSLSTYSAPLLISGTLAAGFYIIFSNSSIETFRMYSFIYRVPTNWWVSSILYVGYNSIIVVVLMSSLLPYLKSSISARLGGLFGGITLTLIAYVLNYAIYLTMNSHSGVMPILAALGQKNEVIEGIYSVVLWLAMFSTAVTSGFCFTERISSKIKLDRRMIVIAFCFLAIPVSGVGFSNLIANLYPAFGYIGVLLVIMILLQGGADLMSYLSFIKKKSD